jgi:hypothetical protein
MTNKEMSQPVSRRNWFAGSAALLGAGAVSSVLARAQSTCGVGSSCTGAAAGDINLLNFLLRLDNLESAFYQKGLAMITPASFQNSVTVQTIGGTKVGANLYSYIGAIAQNEQDHVNALIQTIYSLDGVPQPPDCYNFGITTADSFLQIAQTIETIGVMAYNGAVAMFQSPLLQTLAATIATVEARHAAYLNLLNLTLLYPGPFDTTQTMSQTLSAIGQFMTTGCITQPVPLTLALASPTQHSTVTTNQSTVQLNGSLSTSATGKPLTYLWQQNLGSPLVAIANDTSVITTATLLGGTGVYAISLLVTDSLGNNDQDSLTIVYKP